MAKHDFRYVPFVQNVKIRMIAGLIILILSDASAGMYFGKDRVEIIVLITTCAWILAVFLTDKYIHKYPQRYFTYLVASHLKTAIIMAFFLWLLARFAGPTAAPPDVLWTGFICFILADAIASVPRRLDLRGKRFSAGVAEAITDKEPDDYGFTDKGLSLIDGQAVIRQISSNLDVSLVEFIEKNLPGLPEGAASALVIDDVTTTDDQSESAPVGLLVSRTRINDVRRLNQFMQSCVKRITMGGYFVVRYMPLENVAKILRRRYTGSLYWLVFILYYIWYRAIPKIPWLDKLYFSPMISWLDTFHLALVKRRNRVLSKAEVWGRLSYCGMRVITESSGHGDVYLIAQRVVFPIEGKRPSYYPIVALEKVGLDGEIIYAYKIRTMFPFSEFIQKRIFEDHGLTSTGKFSNDFRLTEIGKFLRRYWLDELPQIFDWLRGDIKLVGLRATSRHFLSLYPRNFLDLYVQIKPGLIPPIYDESTNGFDQIVEVELTYLQRYWDQPLLTDVRYLIQTFTDIVFRGIRSK